MKKFIAAVATIAATLMICACSSSSQEKPDYDKVRARADAGYQEIDEQ